MPGACRRRYRAVGFRNLLRLIRKAAPADPQDHPILDNYGPHKSAMIRRRLARPPFHPHFTPTGASRPNPVGRRFVPLPEKQPRCGTHRSATQPERAVPDHLDIRNQDPEPFKWAKTVGDILNAANPYR